MNIYFVIAGILMILLSLAHALWGERKIFNQLTSDLVGKEILMSVYVPWHQLTYVLLVSGLGLLLSAFRDELAYLPIFILVIVIGNFTMFIVICIAKRQTDMFGKTLPQTILFLLLIVLIILGIVI